MSADKDCYTRDTELRTLSHHQLHQIASKLSHSDNWKKLMRTIPKDISVLDGNVSNASLTTGTYKYTQEHIRMIDVASRSGRHPAHILFEEWGTSGQRRPTLNHLLQLLINSDLYRAADYVAVDILKGLFYNVNKSTCCFNLQSQLIPSRESTTSTGKRASGRDRHRAIVS